MREKCASRGNRWVPYDRPRNAYARKWIPAQHLFDRLAHEGKVLRELAALVRVPVEGDDAVCDQLGDRLVAPEPELLEPGGELVVCGVVLVAIGIDDRRRDHE
jgi:hypothetical protein